ncbi:hypothetical protein Bbelb_148270 [Branchiostoma belcheri]|nr:hypothetical protein Bbelb_148270 [Branchiostoma belcheri]
MSRRKGGNQDDSELVSMSTLKELLDNQKEIFNGLIELQQKNFRSFMESTIECHNKRIDNLIREVQEIKVSLQYTQKDIEDIQANTRQQEKTIKEIESKIMQLKADATTNLNKTDYLENQSRRNNILIDGITDVKEESWEECEQKVRSLLKEKLQLDPKKIEIERAHRNGRFQPDARPRSIVAKLLRFKDKEAILQRARYLKGSNIFINEDFSEAIRQKRKELIPEMKAARERGNVAYLRFDRLIVHPPRPTTRGSSQRHSNNEGTDTGRRRQELRSSGASSGASLSDP